jgi:hypothetical protein
MRERFNHDENFPSREESPARAEAQLRLGAVATLPPRAFSRNVGLLADA